MPRWKDGTPEVVFKLWEWQFAGADHFSAHLFALIAKADVENRLKLSFGFPDHVRIFNRWEMCSNPETFFQQFFEAEPEQKDPEWLGQNQS